MSVIQIASSAVNAKLYNATDDVRRFVSSIISYKVQGAEMSAAYRSNQWDGRSTFFDFKTNKFPAGFVNYVYAQLTKQGHTVQIVKKPLPEPLGVENPKVDNFKEDPRYDYQAEAVRRLLKHGMMIAQVATGGGKSRIARIAYARVQRPTMFLTTRSVLMHQMKDSFEEAFNIKVGVMGDSDWSPRSGFNVAMVQTLAQRLEKKTYNGEIATRLEAQKRREDDDVADLKKRLKRKKRPINVIALEVQKLRKQQIEARPSDAWLAADVKKKVDEHNKRRLRVVEIVEKMEFVILEEAHEAGSNSYYSVMRACKNAYYRLSLTATPFMKDDEEANMRLMAVSGMIGIRVTEEMLIERGILARPYFKFVSLPKPEKLHRMTPWQNAYKHGIVNNDIRNTHIVKEVLTARQYDLPAMVLIQQTAHGKALETLMRSAGLNAKFIFGESKQSERKSELKRLQSGEVDVLIGSTILDVGVDVPSVGMVILAGGGKAEVALRQRIGRGLREKKNMPNVAFIVDFVDQHNVHLSDHFKQREYVIRNTPGFGENVLDPGQQFDFKGLGLRKLA